MYHSRETLFYFVFSFNFFVFWPSLGNAQCSCSDFQMINMRKTALVIGEKSYKTGALVHTLNDAQDIRDSLRKIGFNVILKLDEGKESLENVIDDWVNELGEYQVALFYFSGHGAESTLGNFLFPIDANPNTESELPAKCISANWILERMTKSPTLYNIVLLDACRNNPYTKSWSKGLTEGGLSSMSGTGAFVGFAALPGHTASDGKETDKHGIYTEAILRNITRPNETIYKIFTDINASVREMSDNQQTTYLEGTLSADFCFSPAPVTQIHKKNKTPSFLQPVSKLALSGDEQKVFAIDDIDHEIVVFDANSFSRLKERKIDFGAKTISCSTGESIYLLDTTKNRLLVLDGTSLQTNTEIAFPGKLQTFVLSADEKRAFVAYVDTSKTRSPFISEINLASKSISKNLKVACIPSTLSLSAENRFLFFIGEENSLENPLFQMDTKTYKIREELNLARGSTLIVAPSNNKIYCSCDTLANKPQLDIIDYFSLKSASVLPVNSDALCFSPDRKYLLAASGKVISIIKSDSDIVLNNIALLNNSGGMTCTSDNRLIVWIPKEQRLAIFDLEREAKRQSGEIQDPRLQAFNKEFKRTSSSGRKIGGNVPSSLLYSIEDSIHQISYSFSKELNGEYDREGDPNHSGVYDERSDSLAFSDGFKLHSDPSKKIEFIFHIKYDNGYIYIDYMAFSGPEPSGKISYPFHAEKMEFDKLKAEIRELYLQRIKVFLP